VVDRLLCMLKVEGSNPSVSITHFSCDFQSSFVTYTKNCKNVMLSGLAQRKRIGPITLGSEDRNFEPLYIFLELQICSYSNTILFMYTDIKNDESAPIA
jgi:hypothetical protein